MSAPVGVSRESATARGDVVAAGAVVIGPRRRVLLVHRPKYDDWSFPKGKVERGEHVVAAAVREIAEETGVHARLGVPLDPQHYRVARGDKTVHYWVARPVGESDVDQYVANDEVDAVRWLDADTARRRLTYSHDRATLAQALERRRKTRTLVVVRHAEARARRTWRGDDRDRPLLATGSAHAQRLVPLLAAYDTRRLVSSPSVRCVQTLAPYVETARSHLALDDHLSEEGAGRRAVRRSMDDVLAGLAERPASQGAVALCSHRPVLPLVCEALGVPDPRLSPGELLVAHLRSGAVVALERHRVRSTR